MDSALPASPSTASLLSDIRKFRPDTLRKCQQRAHRRSHSGGWSSVRKVIESKRQFISTGDEDDDDNGGFTTDESVEA